MLASIPHDPRRTIAALFLLPDCDLACRFCASEFGFDTVSFAQADALLVALRTRGYRNLVLGGGEPALWPHGLARLALRAREQGFLVQLNTNGTHPLPGFPRAPGIDRTILPVESVDPAVHDALRAPRGGHLALVLRRIEELIAAGEELTISTVLTAVNVHGIGEIAAWLRGLREKGARVHAWHLYRFLPVGRGGRKHADEFTLSEEAFRIACDEARAAALDFPVYRRPHMLRSSTVEFFWFEGGELVVGSRREASLTRI